MSIGVVKPTFFQVQPESFNRCMPSLIAAGVLPLFDKAEEGEDDSNLATISEVDERSQSQRSGDDLTPRDRSESQEPTMMVCKHCIPYIRPAQLLFLNGPSENVRWSLGQAQYWYSLVTLLRYM